MVELSKTGSEFFLIIIMMSTSIVLKGAQWSKNRYVIRGWSLLTVLIMCIPLSFRASGIDDYVYKLWYENFNIYIMPYRGTPEPLFAGLIYVSRFVLKNFQYIYLVPGVLFSIGIISFLKSFTKDYFIGCFFVMISLYLYMCGLTRLEMALGLCFLSMRYSEKPIRFYTLIVFAILCHYSALIWILIVFAYNSKKNISIKMSAVIALGLVLFSLFLNRFYSIMPYVIQRYIGYVDIHFQFSNLLNVAIIIPALIVFGVFNRNYVRVIENPIGFSNVINILIGMVVLSCFFSGIFRLCFYFYGFVAIIYAYVPYVIFTAKSRLEAKILYRCIFIAAGLAYVYMVFFDSPFLTDALIPFNMNFDL